MRIEWVCLLYHVLVRERSGGYCTVTGTSTAHVPKVLALSHVSQVHYYCNDGRKIQKIFFLDERSESLSTKKKQGTCTCTGTITSTSTLHCTPCTSTSTVLHQKLQALPSLQVAKQWCQRWSTMDRETLQL
jgi:hypothetical protein